MIDKIIYKILIVDDDPNILQLCEKFLNHSRYEVYTAATLNEGIEKSLSILPHLIFLDININTDSGFKFLKTKKDSPGLKNCSIIMMSTDAFSKNVRNAIALGADDFIAKPLVNIVVSRKARKALLKKEKNHVALLEDNHFPVSCLLEFQPLVVESNSIVLEIESRLPQKEPLDVYIDNTKKTYMKIGRSYKTKNGLERCTLSLKGDDAAVKENYSTQQTYEEEDILIERSPTIFILDDDQSFTDLLSSFFSKFKSDIKIFKSITSFQVAIHDKEPDLCIVDLSINELNDTFSLISSTHKRYPNLPLLVVTSNTDGVATAHSLELGASDFLYKPLKRNALIHKIVSMISEDELINYTNLNNKISNHEPCTVAVGAHIASVDELGVSFQSKTFIKKNTLLRLQANELSEVLDGDSVGLRITHVTHDNITSLYEAYGEYLNLDTLIATKLLNYFLTRA